MFPRNWLLSRNAPGRTVRLTLRSCSSFKGRDVTVVGGGASATELATLLHEAGCQVRMVAEGDSPLRLIPALASTFPRPDNSEADFLSRPELEVSISHRFAASFHGLPKSVRSRLVKGF